MIGVAWRRAMRLAAAAAVLAVAGIGATGLPARAASVAFGTPVATSKFGAGIQFVQPYSGGGTPKEVFFVETDNFNPGPNYIRLPSVSSASFTYVVDSSQAQLLPDTVVSGHFQVTLADGSIESGPDTSATYLDDRFNWHIKTGKLVRLHWYQGDDAFATQALAMGEQGVEKDAAFLSTTETKPVDFWVYPDQQPFYDVMGPGTPPNVGGRAYPEIRTLFAWIAPGDFGFAKTVVPHELMHVVYADVIRNAYHYPANWINEGIAVYVSEGYNATYLSDVSDAVSGGTLMPLVALAGEFPTTDANRFELAYAESVSAIDYIVKTYGQPALVKLVKSFATGIPDDDAFKAAFGIDLTAFDKAWMKATGLEFYAPYGPAPAPTGPVPPGWTAAAKPVAVPSTSSATPAASASASGAALSGAAGALIEPGRGDGVPSAVAGVVAVAAILAAALASLVRQRRLERARN